MKKANRDVVASITVPSPPRFSQMTFELLQRDRSRDSSLLSVWDDSGCEMLGVRSKPGYVIQDVSMLANSILSRAARAVTSGAVGSCRLAKDLLSSRPDVSRASGRTTSSGL